MQLNEIDQLEVFVLMDNVSDPFSKSHNGMRWNESQYRFAVRQEKDLCGADQCRACNGLSLLFKLHVNGKVHTILFDAGPDKGLVVENAQRLGVDLTEVDAIILSHGHYDHYGGVVSVLDAIGKKDVPVYLHPELFLPRAFKKGELIKVSYNITKEDVEAHGGKVIENTQAKTLFDDSIMISGEVPRHTHYEDGAPSEHRLKNDQWVNSPDIVDEHCMILNLKNKGICVITACGHTGVINATNHAINITGNNNVHMVMGGFHLAPPEISHRVDPTIQDFKTINPDLIVSGHCTGRDTQAQLTREFGERHIAYSVGTVFKFES